MVFTPTPNQRARGLSEDQRVRLRDLEQTTHLTDGEIGEMHALRLTGNVEESVRCDRVLDRARREHSASKSDKDYRPGLLK
jgi:hypothetical protein